MQMKKNQVVALLDDNFNWVYLCWIFINCVYAFSLPIAIPSPQKYLKRSILNISKKQLSRYIE
jgi:hypothetical protein